MDILKRMVSFVIERRFLGINNNFNKKLNNFGFLKLK